VKRLAVLLLLWLAGCAPVAQQPGLGSVSFALIGDIPYNDLEDLALDGLIEEMNHQSLAFVVHVGDITSSRGPCSDDWFQARRRQFQKSRHPLVVLPGDNDWTDCRRSGFDPLERLARFRELFHSSGESLGQRTLRLERQSRDARFAEYREHIRWTAGNVLFVGLNVPGSNNNLGRTAAMDEEHRKRMSAVLEWLDEAMKIAEHRRFAGVVILMHANPDFEGKRRRRIGVPDGFLETPQRAPRARAVAEETDPARARRYSLVPAEPAAHRSLDRQASRELHPCRGVWLAAGAVGLGGNRSGKSRSVPR
jgi:hypothetical protein